MSSGLGYIIGGIQIVAGAILTFTGIGLAFGIPLMVAGFANVAGAALAPKPAGGRGGFEDSPTYGFDQATNAAFEGAAVPIPLGRVRYAPPLIGGYTEQSGDDQKYHALYLLGAGGRYGISTLKTVWLNDEVSSSYPGVTIRWWPGTDPQGNSRSHQIGGGFGDTVSYSRVEKTGTPYEVNVQITKDTTVNYTTKVAVDELALVLLWPGGLYQIDLDGKDAGEIEPTRWSGTVEYQDDGSTAWVVTGSKDDGWEDGKGQSWSIYAKRRSALRRVIRLKWATKKKRTVRIRSTVSDKQSNELEWVRDPTLLRAEEIINDARAYAGYAIMEVQAVASGALAGGLPTCEVLVDGWKCAPLAGGTATWTQNPAVILHELLLAPLDGLGDWISAADLDDGAGGSWRTVETKCNSLWMRAHTSHTLDLVLDTQQAASEWLTHILGTFRASLVEVGGVLRLIQDVATASDRTFDARQARDSAARPVLVTDEGVPDIVEHEVEGRATHTRVIYFEERENYSRAETVEFIDSNWAASDPIVRKEYFMPGIVRQVQALAQAKYLAQRDAMRTSLVEFGIGPGDFDLLPMDVVTLKADSPTLNSDFQVLGVSYESSLRGRVVALKYDAAVYDDDYRTPIPKATYLSREDALKKAKALPAGITDLRVTVFQA